MIIDSHRHVWHTEQVPISWVARAGLPAQAPLPGPDGPAQGGPRRYVLIEADADDPLAEAEYLMALARQDPRVHGVVPSLPLEGRRLGGILEDWGQAVEVVGVRRLLQDRDHLTSEHFHTNLRIMAENGIPFDACVRAHQLPQLLDLVRQHPGLTVVLDHMGKPPLGDPGLLTTWREHLGRLAQESQVVCKLSGLPAEARDLRQLEDVAAEIVGDALEAFGPERCLLGSDEPVSQDPQDWCLRVLEMVPPEQQEQVGWKTAEAVYSRHR